MDRGVPSNDFFGGPYVVRKPKYDLFFRGRVNYTAHVSASRENSRKVSKNSWREAHFRGFAGTTDAHQQTADTRQQKPPAVPVMIINDMDIRIDR